MKLSQLWLLQTCLASSQRAHHFLKVYTTEVVEGKEKGRTGSGEGGTEMEKSEGQKRLKGQRNQNRHLEMVFLP